jgi:hypothetical protein
MSQLEAQVEIDGTAPFFRGQASQSYQVAPYNMAYQFDNSSSSTPIVDPVNTKFNTYKGNVYQQTISAMTYIDDKFYSGNGFETYGLEWFSNPSKRTSGYINWLTGGTKRWTLTPATIGPDQDASISQRLITEEPMVSAAFLSVLAASDLFAPSVPGLQSRNVPRLPAPGLQAHEVPSADAHRLRARVPAARDEERDDVRSARPPHGKVHRKVRIVPSSLFCSCSCSCSCPVLCFALLAGRADTVVSATSERTRTPI